MNSVPGTCAGAAQPERAASSWDRLLSKDGDTLHTQTALVRLVLAIREKLKR